MARVWLFSCLLFTMAVYALTFEFNLIKVFPEVGRISGVSMVSYGNQYALNASQARAMCLFLNITIATREQVHTAQQHGLETCGYGWIDEQIAVIPRIVQSMKCGRNNIGLIPWRAPINKPFHVFCFNLTDLENPLDITTPKVQTTTKTMTTTTVSTSAPTTTKTVKNRVKTTPKVPAPKSTTQVSRLAPATTTTTTYLVQSTTSFISTSPPPSPSPSSLPCPTSLSHLLPTSSRSPPSSFSPSSAPLISFLSFTSSSLVSSPSQNTSTNHIESPVRAISTALLIILLLLAAAVAVCYYKTTRGVFPIQFWRRGQHNLKDDIETEMWRHTDSEMDLQDPQQREGGEENGDRKSTSDIIVSNPETTTNGP
ncbi:lymphatic vessel endothelial hyaluronic receptor 1b [Salvelinus alpinus]|uniref:lymphatic vessel endothelial hyaluronic receptor 1b n=1 Tax=Salvelinus alpinus TaxID=8036 RepID=UPI0039FC6473